MQDGTCTPIYSGCTDINLNYDPIANVDDGSCIDLYTVVRIS